MNLCQDCKEMPINHPSVPNVQSWQQRIKKRIVCLKEDKFTIAMLDEAFFARDVKAGRQYWSLLVKNISHIHRTT